jgi:hypothetical protein
MHLLQAAHEASHASYSDAADLAEAAEQFAIRAAEVARRHEGLSTEPNADESEKPGANPKGPNGAKEHAEGKDDEP